MTGAIRRIVRAFGLFALIGVLAACTATFRNSGYVPSEEELSFITVGVDDQASVEESVGRPVTQGVIGETSWYYVGSRWEYYAWRAPREIDRQVVAVSFDSNGTVSNIERFGLEDGEVIPLNRRVTDSNIADVSLIRQLLGNIGQFDPNQFFGTDG